MNTGPMLSPEEAIIQIKQILSAYIVAHPDSSNSWRLQAEAGLAAFVATFPEMQKHSLDAIKKHVLEILAPTFVVTAKWVLGLSGASTLREDLEKIAQNWPSHEAYLQSALEKAQQALSDKDAEKPDPRVVDLTERLKNLRTVNTLLVKRLKEKEAEAGPVKEVEKDNQLQRHPKVASSKRK